VARQPKHHVIFESLHAEIIQGRHPAGSLLASEEALCRRWKVSRPTVARALRELQVLGLIERRAGSGTYVRPDIQSQRPVLGLFVEGLGKTEIVDPICAEITRAAQERGSGIFTGGFSAEHSPAEIARTWAKNGIRGVFFAPVEHRQERESYNIEIARAFEKAGLCVVLVDRDVTEYPRRSSHELVAMDNLHAGTIVGLHLAERGCKRVAFVAKPAFPSTTDLRLAGVREGLGRGGGKSVDFLPGDPLDTAFIERILKHRSSWDAIVCSNDLTAAQLLQSLGQKKCRVPDDIMLAGFDDIQYASLLSVPLTTVRQPCRAIGIACVDTMLGRLERPLLPPRSITLRGDLVVRASTITDAANAQHSPN